MLSASKHQWLTLTSAPTSKRYWPPRVGQVRCQMYVRFMSSVPLDITICILEDCECSLLSLELKWRSENSVTIFRLGVGHMQREQGIIKSQVHSSIHSDYIKLVKHNLRMLHCCHACNYQHTGNISSRMSKYVVVCVLAKCRMYSSNGSVVIVIKLRTRFGFHTTVMFLFHILRNNYMKESFNFLKDNYRSVLIKKSR